MTAALAKDSKASWAKRFQRRVSISPASQKKVSKEERTRRLRRVLPGATAPASYSFLVVAVPDVAAHLAAGMFVGMHVGVGLAGAHRPDQLRDLGRRDALSGRSYDVCRRSSAAETPGA